MKHGQISDGQGAVTIAPNAPWPEIVARFRVWSFHVYYEKLYASEIDNTLRFCKALIASSQPIRDREKVIDWYVQRQRRACARRGGERGGHADAASIPARSC
ncbi:MAG TPA: hypothetical protein P5572_12275 [Phycisphaerae bacterium]|nr:hypothetical protein [Phycisphaerae bacterium]